jgi:hypothetical protein
MLRLRSGAALRCCFTAAAAFLPCTRAAKLLSCADAQPGGRHTHGQGKCARAPRSRSRTALSALCVELPSTGGHGASAVALHPTAALPGVRTAESAPCLKRQAGPTSAACDGVLWATARRGGCSIAAMQHQLQSRSISRSRRQRCALPLPAPARLDASPPSRLSAPHACCTPAADPAPALWLQGTLRCVCAAAAVHPRCSAASRCADGELAMRPQLPSLGAVPLPFAVRARLREAK